jgi:sortase B
MELSAPEQPDTPSVDISKAPKVESNPMPTDMQIASITPALRNQILEKKEQNSDAVGWLIVPGTTINDVILQNPPGNNNYYTTHDFSRQPSKDGTYGLDYHFGLSGGTTRDTLSRNTAVYAHNHDDNPEGILFAQLKKYKDPDFAKAHPYIYFSTAEEDMAWEVFAVYDATIDFPYIQPGVYWSGFEPLLETVYDASLYDYGITISAGDKLLTLSTCTFSVPGHESMSTEIQNEYRFVIMAKLVDPEEPIKEEAAFTVNPAPLAPDAIPAYAYLTRDQFMLDGLECNNSWMFFHDNDTIEPINFDNLVPIGIIKQSNMDHPTEDWEATQLPVGTALYQDPEYPDVLVAEVAGEMIPYILQRGERELYSVRYIHQNRDGVMTEKSLESGQFDENEYMSRLSRFIDMMQFTPLPDSMESIERSEEREEILIGAKDSLSTFYQSFFIGIPASVGKEVMIIKQQDGYYYGDAALYAQLKELLDSLFV